MAISVDSQILIWGIKRQATPNRQHMIERAARFFQGCQQDHQQIYLPAQSLAEFLVGYTAEQRRQSLARLSQGFLIAPLDAKAAIIAADLQTDWNTRVKAVMQEFGLTRQQVKADINVLACAIAANASRLYSEDRQMISLANGKILVEPLPVSLPPTVQKPLLLPDE
jgi:predicted nucleic acid-binding protein